MQLAGSDIPLPYYARPDLSYSDQVIAGNVGAGLSYVYRPPAGYLVVITGAYFTLSTSGTATNRAVTCFFQNDHAQSIAAAASTFPQGAGSFVGYSFSVTAPAPQQPVISTTIIPLPLIVLAPGYAAFFGADNLQAGDQVQGLVIQLLLIPTGEGSGNPLSAAPLELVPTPLTV